jgi:outer membrane protein assembly factor BamD (BamD/ComL family)
MAAEIQLTHLDNVPVALASYESMLDSFPEAAAAPKAAYAIAWIHQYKLNEKDTAAARYRSLIERYPRSPQAKGALFQLGYLGVADLKGRLSAFVDSALADTTSLQKTAGVFGDSIRSDTTAVRNAVSAVPVSPDTTGRARIEPPPVSPDTTGRAREGGAG